MDEAGDPARRLRVSGGGRSSRRAVLLVIAAACAAAACGPEVAAGGQGARPPGPQIVRRIEPSDLMPADLDLVVRVDVARMVTTLGPALRDELSGRATAERGEELLRDALHRADVVWLGLRLADIDAGDRVVAIEGNVADLRPGAPDWRPVPAVIDDVSVFDRDGFVPRAGSARVIQIGKRSIVFVSPVEKDSVERVLRAGPDPRRGEPAGEGIVSLDLRARRLPATLERRFPSIGAIVGGLERVRASATLADEGIRLDAQISGKNAQGAERALRFLEALRGTLEETKYAQVLESLSLELVGDTVRLRWTVPAALVIALLGGATGEGVKEAPAGEGSAKER